MTELYTKDILRLTTQIPHTDRLTDPDKTVQKTSRICGSRLTVDAILSDGAISEFAQEVKACALGQAAASLFGQKVIGLTEAELQTLDGPYRHMVKTGDASSLPEGWEGLSILAPVYDHPGRHAAVLLPLDCLSDIFKD